MSVRILCAILALFVVTLAAGVYIGRQTVQRPHARTSTTLLGDQGYLLP